MINTTRDAHGRPVSQPSRWQSSWTRYRDRFPRLLRTEFWRESRIAALWQGLFQIDPAAPARRSANVLRSGRLAFSSALGVEPLEARQLLTGSPIYVEDTDWTGYAYNDPIVDADDATPGNQPANYLVNAFSTIQEGIDAVDPGGTVVVNSGTYTESVDAINGLIIDHNLSIVANNATVDVEGAFTGIKVDAGTTASISGVTLTNFGSTGIEVQGSLNLATSTVDGGLTGIYVNSGTLVMDDSVVKNAGIFGVQVAGASGLATISDSEMLNNSTAGVISSTGTANITTSIITGSNKGLLVNAGGSGSVTNSNLAGNARGVENATPNIVNASGNYWGVGGEAFVSSKRLGLVDFSPYLDSGSDGVGVGFQGDFSHVHVTTLGSQTGAIGRVEEGIDLLEDGALSVGARLVEVNPGLYVDHVGVNKAATVRGPNYLVAGNGVRGSEAIIRAVAVADALIDVNVPDVTLIGLKIDGNDLAASGVRVNEVNDVAVRNNIVTKSLYAIEYDGNVLTGNTGGVVDKNLIQALSTSDTSYGVLAFNAAYVATTDNVMTGLDVGMFEQYYYQPNGLGNPANSVSGNVISAALLGYGTNERSTAAATTALSGNIYHIGTGGVGIQLYNIYKPNGITLTGETIDGAADIGVYAFVSGGSATITGGSITSSAGNIGVQATNYLADYTYAATGDGTVNVSGLTMSGFATGIWVEDNALGAFDISAVVTADTSISNATVGVQVTGPDASATITGNNASFFNNTTGIDVDGGAATIINNHIYGNDTGIAAHNGARLRVESNDLTGNNVQAIFVETGSKVDAGGGASLGTLLGPSLGMNNLSGYDGLTSFAIVDNNLVSGPDSDVYALLNNFGPLTPPGIEQILIDDTDNPVYTQVIFSSYPAVVAPSIVYVDRDWVGTGSLVDADGAGDGFGDGTGFGYDQFATISDALAAVASSGTVKIRNSAGAYDEWNLALNQPVSIIGESKAGVVITPSAVDSHADSTWGGTAVQGFIVNVNGVSIQTLTLDGGVGQNLRNAIIADSDYWTSGGNLTVDDVAINNAYRKGIALYSRVALTTGNSITASTFDNIGTDSGVSFEAAFAIAAFQSSATISGNTFTNFGGGIGSNYIDGNPAHGPQLLITGNTFSSPASGTGNPVIALDLSGLADNSDVSGNTINMSGGSGQDIAIAVQYAIPGADVTVQNNLNITVDAGDTGILLYADADPAHPIVVNGNTLTGVATAKGIVLTDDGSLFGEGPNLGTTYGTLTSNTIMGFGTGVLITSGGATPVEALIGGSPSDSNSIFGAAHVGTGILVVGANSSATIKDNDSSIHGFAVGIDVNGGFADVDNNLIYDNTIGVRYRNGGNGSVTGNEFDSAADNLTDLRLEGLGLVSIGAGNDFAGDTYFIDNRTAQSYDLTGIVTGDQANPFAISDHVYDALDDASSGLIRFDGINLYVSTPGTGPSDETIQRAVNAASTGDVINVDVGTFNENVSIPLRLTLLGAGSGSTIISSTAPNTPVIDITSTGTSVSDRLVIQGVRVTGASGPSGNSTSGIHVAGGSSTGYYTFNDVASVGNAGHGIGFDQTGTLTDVVISNSTLSNNSGSGARFPSSLSSLTGLSVTGTTMNDNNVIGLSLNPDIAPGFSATGIVIATSNFANNGDGVSVGEGDISLLGFNGTATITDVVITADSHIGLQLRGAGLLAPSGSVILTNVTVNGTPAVTNPGSTPTGIFIANYTDVSAIQFSDVNINVTGATVGGLVVDTAGPATLDINDTVFGTTTGAYIGDASPTPIDATGATFDGVSAFSAMTADAYAIVDKIVDGVDIPTLGLVRLKANQVYVTAASFLAPFTTTPNIQRAVDAASSGDTVHIQAGTYTGSVSTAGKIITLSPGDSPGQVTLIGNLTLDSNDFLTMEILGTSAATQYDNFIVTGTVTLNNATLNATRGLFAPSVGNSFTLVDNDAADPISGTFAGLAEGATLTLNNIPFTISYTGGSGNDVVLTVAAPTTVWVNDTWLEQTNVMGGTLGTVEYGDIVNSDTGALPSDTFVNNLVFGYNAFATLIGGVAAVTAGGTVNVLAGTYTEGPQVYIGKNLVIDGQSSASVTINAGADTGNIGDARGWFLVDAGYDVDISDVTLDGDGFKVWQAIRDKGTGTINNVVFNDIQYEASGPSYNGTAIAAFGGVGALDITNSTFTNIGREGVLYYGAGTTGTFSGNTYTGKGAGDWLDYAVEIGAGAQVNISANTITNNLGVSSFDLSESAGILITTFYGGGSQATIQNNFITGNSTGVAVGYDNFDTSIATIFNNDLSGNTIGVSQTGTAIADASGNWFGVTSGVAVAALIAGSVDYTPWFDVGADTSGAPGFQGDFSYLHVDDNSLQVGPIGRIQEGINLLANGLLTGGLRTVEAEAGTYAENVNINKPMTLLGQGSTPADSVISVTSGNAVTIAASSVTIEDFRVAGTGATNGIYIDSATSNDSLTNVVATGHNYGFEIHNAAVVTTLNLDQVSLINNNVGLRVATTGKVSGLSVNNGTFDNNNFGWDIEANSGSSLNQNDFTNVVFTGASTFSNNVFKGLYAEKLNNANLSGITAIGSGTGASSPSGIDLNLKYGTYTGIALANVTLTNNGTGSATGTGLAIKGRNDAPYNVNPATVSGVSLTNVAIDGSPIDLSIGNSVTGLTFSGVQLLGAGAGLVYYVTAVDSINLANTSFAGTLASYIGNASANPIDATTGATFGGFNTGVGPVAPNLTTYFSIENKIVDAIDVPGLGLVRLNTGDVFVTPNSFYVPGGTTTPSIQRAVNAAVSGDVVHIQTGTYTGNVTTTLKSVTLSPGSSPGQVTLNGDLTLDSDDFVAAEFNGVNPATQYDNFIINGAVTLGSATLQSTAGYTPSFGSTFTLVNNDGADPVVGTFAGLPEGSIINLGGSPFTLSYTGGTGNDIVLTVDTLYVTNFVSNASGFDVTFNRTPTLSDLNLYDGSDAAPDPADVTLFGSGGVGNVLGSMVWNEATKTMSFVKTGGILAPATYTVTLFSGATRFHDAFSDLDGNHDFVPGDNFSNVPTYPFVISASSNRVVSVRDFARGPGQAIEDNPAAPVSPINPHYLEVTIDNPAGVHNLDAHLIYDPSLLQINGASIAAGLPGGWSVTFNNTPGDLYFTASGGTPLSASHTSVVLIDAVVKTNAPYGNSEVLRIVPGLFGMLNDNDPGFESTPDFAIHKNLFLGDADGDGVYSAQDPLYISQVVVNLTNGFDASDWTDPRIVADTSNNGGLSGTDASQVAAKAALLTVPQIPDITVFILAPRSPSGVDPTLSIDPNIPAIPGGAVNVPVKIAVPSGEAAKSATFDVIYDNSKLLFTGSTEGAFWPSLSNWSLTTNEYLPGKVRVILFNSQGNASPIGSGVIANLQFSALPATSGTAALDVVKVAPLNEGGLTWTDTDDGSVLIGSQIAGRFLFYNQSVFDGTNAAQDTSDDLAIAPDKSAYLPYSNTLAVFNNVSSYSRGINGIMIDLNGAGSHAAIDANDFVFKHGNDNAPGAWALVTATPTISVRLGQGTLGSDRVTITWAASSIKNEWLEVQVLPTVNTGLASTDVFFWGNKAGDVGAATPADQFLTSGADKTSVLNNQVGGVPITNTRDFNRDGNVTAADATAVVNNQGTIERLQLNGGPFAPEAGELDGDTIELNGVVSAFAVGYGGILTQSLDVDSAPVMHAMVALAAGGTAVSSDDAAVAHAHAFDSEVDELSDGVNVDDELLASLLEGLGS